FGVLSRSITALRAITRCLESRVRSLDGAQNRLDGVGQRDAAGSSADQQRRDADVEYRRLTLRNAFASPPPFYPDRLRPVPREAVRQRRRERPRGQFADRAEADYDRARVPGGPL